MRLIYFLKLKSESLFYKLRIIFYYYFFRINKITIGKNLRIKGGRGVHTFGENLHIYDNVVFECHSNFAKIETGKNCVFSFGVIILFYKNIFNKNKIYLLSFNIFAILNILFIFLAYLTREIEILYSIKTTMERLVFTSSGFYLFLILSMINEKIEIKKKWNLY
jgi:hypothetical protein